MIRNPRNHGRMKRYATHVSRSRNPDSQRRAREGPGAGVLLTVTLAKRPMLYLFLSIAAWASFCAWFSAAFTDCWPFRTRLIASRYDCRKAAPPGFGGSSKPYFASFTRTFTASSNDDLPNDW